MSGLDFDDEWTATDGYPILTWQVENVSLDLADSSVMVGQRTQATITLELYSGRTVTANTTATIESNTSALTVEGTTLRSSDRGTAAITASVAGHSDTATLSMLAPPDVDFESGDLDRDLLARGTSLSVNASFFNSGDIAGDHTATLSIDGTDVDTETITVEGRESSTIEFDWTSTETGTYDVTVDGSTVGTVDVVEPPEIETHSATLASEAVLEDQHATVTATVENPDRIAGERLVALRAEGANRTTQTVSVDAETSKSVTLAWTPETAGSYNLSVDGQSAGTLTVVSRDTISVDNVSAPEQVLINESTAVTATVSSEANASVIVPVSYRVDGTVVASENVTVGPNSTTVAFEQAHAEAGTVTHSVVAASAEATAETEVRAPANLAVTNLAGSDAVATGTEVTVTATLENTGDVRTNQTVEFTLDGATVASKEVSLGPGKTTRTSASFTLQAGGEHDYGVATDDDSVTATMTARQAIATTTSEPSGDESSTDSEVTTTAVESSGSSGSGSGPGFGIGVAMLALVALAGAATRRA